MLPDPCRAVANLSDNALGRKAPSLRCCLRGAAPCCRATSSVRALSADQTTRRRSRLLRGSED